MCWLCVVAVAFEVDKGRMIPFCFLVDRVRLSIYLVAEDACHLLKHHPFFVNTCGVGVRRSFDEFLCCHFVSGSFDLAACELGDMLHI